MIRQCRRLVLGALCAVGLVPVAARAQGATTGVIAGRVVDAASQQPLAGATVVIAGTTRGTIATGDGTFRIVGVTPGTVQVRAQRIGYAPSTQTATVTPGGTATLNFALAATAVQLDVVVTSATGESVRKRERGDNASTIQAADIQPSAVNSFAGVLQGRAPGVTIQQSGGTTGTGARVRVRGANSVSLSNEPLLIIDGVRVNNAANSYSIGVGGQAPSRLNDLNPNDIENIEILKGPAATGLFGTAAANGVIQVTTKKGRSGRPRWSVYTEQGGLADVTAYPANYGSYSPDPRTGASGLFNCFLADVAGDDPACPRIDSLARFNPLEDASPFQTGYRQRYGANVQGGLSAATYYLSADYEGEKGIYKISDLDRLNLRANVNATIAKNLNVGVNAGYLTSGLRLPINDNSNLGIVSGGLLGQPVRDARLGYFNRQPDTLFVIDNEQDIERFTGGLNGTYAPLSWLNVTATLGYDVLNRHDNVLFPPNLVTNTQANREGSRTSNRIQAFNYTGNASATATFNLNPNLVSTTTVGTQYLRDNFTGTYAFGAILSPGGRGLDQTNSRFSVGEDYTDNRTLGVLAQQQLAFKDRLFGTVAIRGDDNSAFGQDFGLIYYPSASLSYVISDEPFFPENRFVNSLRLRTAYGRSGLRPGAFDAIRYFDATPVTTATADAAGFTFGNLGNPDLKPELTQEIEGGFDLGLFNNRASFEVTAYLKKSRDALIAVVLPSSAGVGGSVFRNVGGVSNRGLEALLTTTLFDRPNFRAEANVNYTLLRNRLDDLGEEDPIIFGLGGDTQKHVEGRPLGGYHQRPYTYDDANRNGIIEYDEVTVRDTSEYLGNSQPTRTLALSTNLTFFKYFRFTGLVDYQGGYKQYNATEDFRCSTTINCRALYDSTASLFDQARAIADYQFGTVAGYIEDGSFVKLRELSLSIGTPDTFARRLFGARGLSFTLSGRNLATWTDYTGFDPEVNFAGQANFSQGDFLTQPPVRFYTARIDLNF